ncbi:DUF1513 domain-containing protein [Psychrobacter sp.]|uniref:DUF1513 domain-containing protein n=1 Tax=Psychrobacter sp. TaxID=56811 RepID=UPI0025EA72D5|nr:DUF1513 domain-containing protein [Psychrobacter sp.]
MSSKSALSDSLKTLGLSALGTAALVGAHHLGRKQYDANAQLSDYGHGFTQALACVISRARFITKARVITRLNPKDTTIADGHKSVKNHISANRHITAESDITTDSHKINSELSEISWVSGAADLNSNEFAVVGIDAKREIQWQTPLPERVHDILIQPKCITHGKDKIHNANIHVAVMGRRPSEWFWVLEAHSGKLLYSVKSEPNRHFYGHACYSLQGDLLYVTENNTSDLSGIIGIYEVVSGYKKIGEFATQGIGPHEIVMHPDGETLIVANGGIKTERASREELNIESMQPSLVYLNCQDGSVIQQVYPEHNQMSVRHLAIHKDGTVIIGIQFQGERHLSVPMVLIHRLGDTDFTPLTMTNSNGHNWLRFHHYIASVSVNSDHSLVCATSPIGGCTAVFDLKTGKLIDIVEISDCAGVAAYPNSMSKPDLGLGDCTVESASFLVSDGQGALTQITLNSFENVISVKVDKVQLPYAFDNHLNLIEAS